MNFLGCNMLKNFTFDSLEKLTIFSSFKVDIVACYILQARSPHRATASVERVLVDQVEAIPKMANVGVTRAEDQ